MHQQFSNVPMEKCDPQMYLGQGHFSNLSRHHKGQNTTSALTLADLEDAARLRAVQPTLADLEDLARLRAVQPTLADLEDAARLRAVQPTLFTGPHLAPNNISNIAYPKQPVDASSLKCPIIMMNNPFRRQTDRDRPAGSVGVETDPIRDMSSSQQCIGLDRAHLGGSGQSAENPDNHGVGETNAAHGFGYNDASHESAHRANPYHPVLSSGNQLFEMPQSRLCDHTHNYDNDARVTECGNLCFPAYTHQQDLRGQCQDNPAYTHQQDLRRQCQDNPAYTHQQDLRRQCQDNPAYTHQQDLRGQRQDNPAYTHQQDLLGQGQGNPAYTHQQDLRGQCQDNPAYTHQQDLRGQCQDNPAYTHQQDLHSQRQDNPAYTHQQDLLGQGQGNPAYTHQQDLLGQGQGNPAAHFPPHAVFPSGRQLEHAGTNQYRPNHTEPAHNMVLYYQTGFQQTGQPPRMAGEVVTHDLEFGPANNFHINPNLTSQPMFTGVATSHYGHHHGMDRTMQEIHTTQGCHPTNMAAFHGISMSETSPYGEAYSGCHQLPGARRGYLQNVNIQDREKSNFQKFLVPGRVLQEHGAPMTGKSTLARQAISDAISNSHQTGQLCDHHFTCKGVARFQDLLSLIVQNLYPQYPRGLQLDADLVLKMIGSFLQQNPLSHHVLVFHKCENLRDNPHGQQFLEFLTRIANGHATLSVSVVFTTYKYYWTPQRMAVAEVKVDVLSITDIITLLQYYVPHIDDCVGYANVLVKTFCFPEAVRLIAEEYLADRNSHVTPEKLEKIINKDRDLLSLLFEHRLPEVDTWVSKKDLLFLTHFKHSIENSFTEAHLEYVNSSDLDQVQLQKVINYLKKNHLVRSLPGIRRLVIHPLIVYHSMVSSSRDRQLVPGKWFDNTCNRYTYFLGRVLMSIESNMQEHGRKSLVFSGLIQEWPNVQYVFQMALHCNVNTYENFIKVAVTASNYILKIFPREAESFYWCLYNSAKDYGTPVELAVMEAFLGQAIAEGTGKDWTRANHYLSSAIERLSRFGNSYYLGWAIDKKGIIHHRQGKYHKSQEYLDQASNVLENVDRWALGEQFVVPEAKIDEEMITQKIHMAIPIIFTGRNQEARRHLDKLLELIQNCFENHPDIGTLLNLIGLTEQRGNRDKERALMWYKLSYHERMYWAKACPESLLAVLNNIAMIYFYQGNHEESVKYLEKALAIRRECGWTHYYTGLTLVHVAEINMKAGNLVQAYKSLLEAERILAATVKDHDMKLRVNFDLAHVRVLLRQALEPHDSAAREFPRSFRSQNSFEQTERASETRCTQGGHLGAEGNGAQACNRPGHRKTSWDTSDDSVTSSQLFEAGDGSQQEMDAAHHHQHSDNTFHPFPTPEDILRIQAAEIEPCDLRMSAEDYFQRILTIASTMQGTFSDDGLSLVLCSHEHQMLLNMGNSPEKFEKHLIALLKFSEDNPWLEVDGDTDTGLDSKYRCLIKHKPLYNYVCSTPYESLNIRTFIEHMLNACSTCNFVNDTVSVDKWETEAIHCIQERDIRKRRKQEFAIRRSNRQSSERGNAGNNAASSSAVDNMPACDIFVELGQNCVCTNMINTQNVPSTESEVCLQHVCTNMINTQNVPSTKSEVRVQHVQQTLPQFQQLLSAENSFQDGGRIMGLHHRIATDQSEVHRQPPDTLLDQSFLLSPRIAKIQEEILEKIQNKKDSCLLSESVEAEKSLPDSRHVCGKTYGDGRSMAVPGILTSRMPVEQSYHSVRDTALNSNGRLHPHCDGKFSRQASACNEIHSSKAQPLREFQKQTENLEQRKRYVHTESGIPSRQTSEESRCYSGQTLAETEQRNIVTDHISNRVLSDDTSKSQKVLEKRRSDWTSQSDSSSDSISGLHSSTSEQKYGHDSPRNESCKTSADGTFSVLDYIRYACNMDLPTSTESEASASKIHPEEFQQQIQHPGQHPSEEQRVTRVQDETVDGRHVALHDSGRSSLVNTRKPLSASPSSQSYEPAPFSEKHLHLHTVPPGKHTVPPGKHTVPPGKHTVPPGKHTVPPGKHTVPPGKHTVPPGKHTVPPGKHTVPPGKHGLECVTEGQPRLHLQCVGSKEAPDGSEDILDSGLNSASVGNPNDRGPPNRRASRRSRVLSSSSSSSSSRHACSHVASTIESGYSSEQHLTGMPTTRPVACALPGARYNKNYCATSQLGQAFSDILFHSPDDLPTEVEHTNAMTETSGRVHTETGNLLTAVRYMQALARLHFPDQSIFSQAGALPRQHSHEQQQPPQPVESPQADNQAAEFLSSLLPCLPVFPENPNDQISFREPVEQSWNETLVPNWTQPSAEVSDMSESGCMIRRELRLLENRIRQQECEISSDSEEITLAENVRSSQS